MKLEDQKNKVLGLIALFVFFGFLILIQSVSAVFVDVEGVCACVRPCKQYKDSYYCSEELVEDKFIVNDSVMPTVPIGDTSSRFENSAVILVGSLAVFFFVVSVTLSIILIKIWRTRLW